MNIQYDFVNIDYRGTEFRLAYFIRPAQNPTLLYLHGLGGSKSDFVTAAASSALKQYTLVGIDIPGCGQSNYFENEPLKMHDVAEIIYSASSTLGLKKVILIGFSFSGITSILLCKSHPDWVQGLINVEGNLAPEDCAVISREVCEFPFEGREEEYFSHLRRRMIQFSTGCHTFAETFRANIRSVRAWQDYCKSIVDCSDNARLLDEYVHLKIPRVFLYGEENRHLSYLSRLRTENLSVVEVPNSNHFICYSNPEFQYQTIADFVRNNEDKAF